VLKFRPLVRVARFALVDVITVNFPFLVLGSPDQIVKLSRQARAFFGLLIGRYPAIKRNFLLSIFLFPFNLALMLWLIMLVDEFLHVRLSNPDLAANPMPDIWQVVSPNPVVDGVN